MWRKSKQVERAACDRLLADMGTVLQYSDELDWTCADEVGGPGRWCGHAQRAAFRLAAAVGVADRHGG